jgi:hypothetical protein
VRSKSLDQAGPGKVTCPGPECSTPLEQAPPASYLPWHCPTAKLHPFPHPPLPSLLEAASASMTDLEVVNLSGWSLLNLSSSSLRDSSFGPAASGGAGPCSASAKFVEGSEGSLSWEKAHAMVTAWLKDQEDLHAVPKSTVTLWLESFRWVCLVATPHPRFLKQQ